MHRIEFTGKTDGLTCLDSQRKVRKWRKRSQTSITGELFPLSQIPRLEIEGHTKVEWTKGAKCLRNNGRSLIWLKDKDWTYKLVDHTSVLD